MTSNFSYMDEEGRVSACSVYTDSLMEKIFKTLAYCIMLLLALSGNVFLVCVVYSQRKLRTTTNFLISNMAISDLLVPVFAMPRTIVEIHLGLRRWLITGTVGLVLCKMIYFLQDVSTAVSVLSLSCITIDRFYAVVRPQNSTPIKGRVRIVIVSIWIIAMFMHATYFYTFKLVTSSDVTYCVLSWPTSVDPVVATKFFFLTLIVLLYFIPLVLIVVLQWLIIKKLRKQRLPSFSSSLRQRKRGKRNKKVVHFTLAVIVTFFFCWTPTVVYSFIVIFGDRMTCIPELFRFASLFLVQSNSSINFFIYFLFNDNYRRTFKKIFCDRNVLLKILRRSGSVQLVEERKRARSKTMSVDSLPDAQNSLAAENIAMRSQVTLVGVKPIGHCMECRMGEKMVGNMEQVNGREGDVERQREREKKAHCSKRRQTDDSNDCSSASISPSGQY